MTALSELLERANTDHLTDRQIADRAAELGEKVSATQVWRARKGLTARPTEPALRAFSRVLSIPMERLREAASMPTEVLGPYIPPPEAERIGARAREAVDTVIRLLAAPEPLVDIPPLNLAAYGAEGTPEVLTLVSDLDELMVKATEDEAHVRASLIEHLMAVLRSAMRDASPED